ncbi:MAG: hypothetical protein UW95_C0015G0029 [Parcubacteria group bacterium GW2011_GWC1_45_14]|nr:MAG: hypothetical protein UW95_C0015G0029 [Parcubacteria group bacterium GW2011_GWC1_45_14]
MEKIILDNPWILLALVAWMIPWKGWALWRAALAILEIIYILFFSRKKIQKEEVQPEPQPKIKITHNLQKPKLTL